MRKSLLSFASMLLIALCLQAARPEFKPAVSILGDSYSTFQGYLTPDTNTIWYFSAPPKDRTDVDKVSQTWWHKFISENGYRLDTNNSFSGSTICNTGYDKADYSDRSFLTRMNRLGCPDIIFIFGATNDSWANSPIGEYKYENQTPEELYSFRPALAKLLGGMKLRYPNVEIIFILNDGLKPEITESVNTICNHYEIGIIPLKDIDKINGHPSVKGMDQISDQISQWMTTREK